MQTNITEAIREFIDENFLFRDDQASLSDTDSLLEAGLIDSTGILELVSFLEARFEIAVEDSEIIPENLDAIASIARYVATKTSLAPAAA